MQVLRCRVVVVPMPVWRTGVRANPVRSVMPSAGRQTAMSSVRILTGRCVMLMWHMPLNRGTTDILFHAADAW